MGDKFSNKNKHSNKKLTKKEQKAANHLKLMQGGKERQETNITVAQKDKKAA